MIRGLALCAGAGGLELGLRLCLGDAYRCVGYVERDAHAAATLVARMEDEALDRAPVWDDIATFDGRPWRGRVDLLSAGFPCQPSSAAGRRRGTDDERWLWPDVARVVGAAGPGLVFVENVPGLRSVNGGAAFHEVVGDLSALGFDAEWDVFAASEVGAPQLRERLFLLAYRHGGGRCGFRVRRLPDRQRTSLRNDADRCDQDVALAGRERGQRPGDSDELAASPGGEQGEALQREWTGHAVVHGRGPLANAGGCRWGEGRGRVLDGRHGPFPPGPRALDKWACVLAADPQLAPALEPRLRGVVDGMAGGMVDRADRLRVLGNGVVPLVAAVAFLALAARAGLDLGTRDEDA